LRVHCCPALRINITNDVNEKWLSMSSDGN
jgi:hypothetical protein